MGEDPKPETDCGTRLSREGRNIRKFPRLLSDDIGITN